MSKIITINERIRLKVYNTIVITGEYKYSGDSYIIARYTSAYSSSQQCSPRSNVLQQIVALGGSYSPGQKNVASEISSPNSS